jgi:lantibiotic biosynthesis protein
LPARTSSRSATSTVVASGSGSLAATALDAARHVAERLKHPQDAARAAAAAAAQSQFPAFSQWSAPSLAQGNAGLALLWAQLDACFPDEHWDLVGKEHLEIAAHGAEQGLTCGAGLFSGLSGLAFAAWQLSRGGTRYRRLLSSLDEAIARDATALAARVRTSDGLSVNDFDVISGLSGVGAYLLCRQHEPVVGLALGDTARALVALATRGDAVPAWRTPASLLFDDTARQTYPHGNLNCGLAHGVPGVLAFLSLARLDGVEIDRLDEAITTIADWLRTNRYDDEWGVNWPTAVPLETVGSALRPADPAAVPGGPSRAAWCYGAPGIARALWLAGNAMDRTEYRDTALAAMDAIFRRPISARMIDSPTFCHGVAGLLAIAWRFARETGDARCLTASNALTGQLLACFQPDSLVGFRNLEYRGNQTDQPGLLDGAAGVAIVLLSVATGVVPSWDRAFLLS